MTSNPRRHVHVLSIVLSMYGATAFAAEPPAAPSTPATPESQPTDAKSGGPLSPEQRLAKSAKLYAEATTYRDEGTLVQEMDSGGRVIKSTMPFATAFERSKRFRWQFQHSASPGRAPDQRFTIWSTDGKTFRDFWTLTGQGEKHDAIDMPLASATGISGGAATAIIPLLKIADNRFEGLLSTDLTKPEDKGKEAVDGIDCWKIVGKTRNGDATSTLWIDDGGLIRKIHEDTVVDPSKLRDLPKNIPSRPKFTVKTTMTFKPFVNEATIDDTKFAPDEKNPGTPAK